MLDSAATLPVPPPPLPLRRSTSSSVKVPFSARIVRGPVSEVACSASIWRSWTVRAPVSCGCPTAVTDVAPSRSRLHVAGS